MPYANVHGMIKELLDRVRSLEARVTTLEGGKPAGSASNDGEPVDPDPDKPKPGQPVPGPQDPPEPPPQDPPEKAAPAAPSRHRAK